MGRRSPKPGWGRIHLPTAHHTSTTPVIHGLRLTKTDTERERREGIGRQPGEMEQGWGGSTGEPSLNVAQSASDKRWDDSFMPDAAPI